MQQRKSADLKSQANETKTRDPPAGGVCLYGLYVISILRRRNLLIDDVLDFNWKQHQIPNMLHKLRSGRCAVQTEACLAHDDGPWALPHRIAVFMWLPGGGGAYLIPRGTGDCAMPSYMI